jgi:hypothetical protein
MTKAQATIQIPGAYGQPDYLTITRETDTAGLTRDQRMIISLQTQTGQRIEIEAHKVEMIAGLMVAFTK